jgi:NitT/TauT family transport system ATP-binding protein
VNPSPPEPPALVALDRVGKTFANGVRALSHMSIAIAEGEFVTLLGPSGCGKSTALRILAGLIEPTTGEVRWKGGASADHRAQIGFVFQDPTLMPWADVADNVWLPLRLRGTSKSEARGRIAESLALVGMSDFAKALPHQLSGGMKMRVSIARALTLRPKLLLMDEPFAALDEMTRFRLNDDLLTLRHRLDCTVVFVTHSIFESVYLSDRIAIMSPRPGGVVAEVRIDETRARDADFRTSFRYVQTCRDVSRLLADGDAMRPS